MDGTSHFNYFRIYFIIRIQLIYFIIGIHLIPSIIRIHLVYFIIRIYLIYLIIRIYVIYFILRIRLIYFISSIHQVYIYVAMKQKWFRGPDIPLCYIPWPLLGLVFIYLNLNFFFFCLFVVSVCWLFRWPQRLLYYSNWLCIRMTTSNSYKSDDRT